MIRLTKQTSRIPLWQILLICLSMTAIRAQFQIESWTTDNGLPQNTVYSILQTPDGYLWLATLDGAARFDGVKFTVFNKNNTKGIESNRFTKLVLDRHGDLWLGLEMDFITRYRQGTFETFSLKSGDRNIVRKLFLNAQGEIVAATDAGFFQWNDESFGAYAPVAEEKTKDIFLWNGSGTFWYADKQTLFRVRDNQIKAFHLPAANEETRISEIFEDSRGRVWLGTQDAGLFFLENEKINVFPLETSSKDVKPTIEDRDGNVWATSANGAIIIAPDGKVSRVTGANGLSEDLLTTIFQDREGTIWIGTTYQGLNRLSRQSVTFYTTTDGLSGNGTNPIFQDRAGDIWIGGGNLTRYHDGIFSRVAGREKFPKQVTAIGQDRTGRVWFGHWGGAYYFEDNQFTDFSAKFNLDVPFYAVHEDRNGAIWFATGDGLYRFQNDAITHLTTADGLAGNDAKVILESKNGTLWIGTYGGLSKFENGELTSFTAAEGLASNQIRSLYEDTDEVLWIGSYDGGLTRLKNGKFTRYTSNDGLYNDGVFQILEDDNQNFWMSSNRGIYLVARQQLNNFADGRVQRIESIAYNKADGLEETECNGGQQPAGIRARDGKLWFPTQGGVAVIDPNNIKTNPYPPPVVLEAATIDGEAVAANEEIRIVPGKNNLEITYTALSFTKPEFVKFRYKLVGLDKDWTEAGTRRTAFFSYLPPGDYTFQVIAVNSDGIWNTEGASVKIVVVPPVYRTWWFLGLSACLITGAIYLLYRRRIINLKKKEAAQHFFSQQLIESQERERQRIAGELHDGLSQNLVIIKNRAMMSLSDRENSEYVFEQIEEIVEAAGESLAEVRVIANNLRPFQIDRLGLTKAIEALVRKANSPNLHVASRLDNIDGVFAPAMEINLYRIVQESLNNIIKHSKATEAMVTIKKTANQIEVAIKDDGKGFDPNAARNNDSANNSGFGITGIFERARMFGSIPQIESNAGNGTIIRLKIVGSFG